MTEQKNETIAPAKPAQAPSLSLKAVGAPGKKEDHVCQCGCGKK